MTPCHFVAHLYNQHLSTSSIRLYLSALRFHQIAQGGSDPSLSTMPLLHYVIRGVARGQPMCNRPPRLPITLDILLRLFWFWSTSPARYEAIMLWAACTLGFFGFLRSGEFTVVPGGNQALVSPRDIQVDSRQDSTYVAITLHGSKTDPFGVGCTLFVGRTNSIICPVTALLAYLAIRPPSPGPLFIHDDGSPLTRSGLVSAVRAALSGGWCGPFPLHRPQF